MKLTLQRKPLLAAASAANGVASTARNIKPVLSCAYLSARDGTVKVQATNLEMAVSSTLASEAVEIHAEGELCVGADSLAAICRASNSETITITIESRDTATASVAASRGGSWTLPTCEPRDFPGFPATPNTPPIQLAAADLGRAIRLASLAARGDDPGKFHIKGVQLTTQGAQLTCVGTDTKWLSVCTVPLAAKIDDGVGNEVVIPVQSIKTIISTLADASDDDVADVWFSRNEIWISVVGVTIYTRLLECRFPPWRTVVPKKIASTAEAMAGIFQSAIRLLDVARDAVCVEISLVMSGARQQPKALKLTTNDPMSTTGQAEAMATVIDFTGDRLEEALFSREYLGRIFAAMEADDKIRIGFTPKGHMIRVDSGDWTSLLMGLEKPKPKEGQPS